MGIVAHDDTLFPATQFMPSAPLTAPDEGGFFDAFGSAFLRQNDVRSLYRLANQPDEPTDLNWDFDNAARQSKGFAQNPEPFYRARSQNEFNRIEANVAAEMEMLRREQSSGLGAFLGGLSGAILSPTTLLPGGAIYRGAKMSSILKSAASVGLAAAGGAAIQETILQGEQELRTGEETAGSILFSLALGGLIGGAVSGIGAKEMGKLRSDMATDPGAEAIRQPPEGTLSAMRAPDPDSAEALNLGEVAGITKGLTDFGIMQFLNPVSRGFANAYSGTVRAITGSLDTGGLRVDGQVNLGGDVASRAKRWDALSFHALQKREELMGGNFLTRTMGSRKFSEETALAMRRGGEHENPQVAEYAKYLRDNVYEVLRKEAETVGIKGFDKLEADYVNKYVNRMVRKGLVVKDHDIITGILKEHFNETLTSQWTKTIDRVDELNLKDEETAADISLDKEQVFALRDSLEVQIRNLPQQFSDEIRNVAEEIRALRAEAKTVPKDEAKLINAEADSIEKQNMEMLKPFRLAENKLKGRRSRLGRTASGLERKQQAALQQIEALQEAADATRGKLVKQVNRIMQNLDRWSDEVLDAEIAKLQDQVEKTFAVWAKGDARIAKMSEVPDDFRELEYSDVRPTDKISIEEARQQQRQEKLDDLLETLDEAKSLDREGKRLAVEQVAKAAVAEAEVVNFKRAKQEEVLRERIAAADPQKARLEAEALREKAFQRGQKMIQRAAASKINASSKADLDVSEAADELANYVAGQYMGNSHHMPMLNILEERGPELARMLNIDETRTWSNGAKFEDFLENDAELLMRSYARTMGSDIELQRKFGRINPLAQDSPYLRKVVNEFDEARKAARAAADAKIAKGGSKEKVEKALDKELTKIANAQKGALRDMHGLIDRIRHTRGVPEDAEAIGYRMGKGLRNLNTTTMMGNMMLTSVADLASVVIKHGFIKSFKDGFVPMIQNFQRFKVSAREAQDAGIALDMLLHSRVGAIADVLDEIRGGTLAERSLQFATNHMGMVTGMNRWNAGIKQLEAVITITQMSRQLETVAAGGKGAKKAQAYLSGLGIDERNAALLWKEFQRSGDTANGLTLPNTKDWGRVSEAEIEAAEARLVKITEDIQVAKKASRMADRKVRSAELARERAAPGAKPETIEALNEKLATAKAEAKAATDALEALYVPHSKAAVDAQGKSESFNQANELRAVFRAAVARAVDDTIVTPGGERPLWMDGSEMGRIIGQFRSFTFASNQKILWRASQDLRAGDVAPLGGLVFSVALGSLSWYMIQMAKGGEAAEKAQSADWEKFLLEGIERSLLPGVMAEPLSFAQDIPGPVSSITSLGTGPRKRNAFAGPVSGLLGPTMGQIKNLDSVVSGVLSGDMSDGDWSSLRRMIPYNNVFWASRAFTAIEEDLKK